MGFLLAITGVNFYFIVDAELQNYFCNFDNDL